MSLKFTLDLRTLQMTWKTLPVFPKRFFYDSVSRHWVSKNIQVIHSRLETFCLSYQALALQKHFSNVLARVPERTALINYVLFISTVRSRVDFHKKKSTNNSTTSPLSNFRLSEFCQNFVSNFPKKKSIRFLNSTSGI